MKEESTALIIALTDSPSPHFRGALARFLEEADEVLVVDASGGSDMGLAADFPGVRRIDRPAGWLAPELWRDGLLETEADLVGFTTASMRPRRGWLDALKSRLEESGAAGVGGPIEPGSRLGATDRAVALLRYANYFPTLCRGESGARPEPPGDNALYRRDLLLDVEPSWRDGFWEVEVHAALRERGETLAMAESAVVTFEGGSDLASMIVQRFRHARRYGMGRSKGLGAMARRIRVATAPLVPLVLASRIARALRRRGMSLMPWLPALPPLAILATAWAIGEAVGTWRAGSRIPADRTREPIPQLARGAR